MTLRITVIPASTQAGKETIQTLLRADNPPIVHAVYRDPSKAPSEFTSHVNFKAITGDVSGNSELDFSSSDAIFYIPPPIYDGSDTAEFARSAANKVKHAVQKAPSVKRLLVFSAIGAQYDTGIGILKSNHITDEILKDSAPEVVITKAGFFMENWALAFETIKNEPPFFESVFTPLDHKLAMLSIVDIGKICAQVLRETGQPLPSNPHIFDLHGPSSYSAIDVKTALEAVTGHTIDVRAISPEQLLEYYRRKVSATYAQELAEMTVAMNAGGLVAMDVMKDEGVVRGDIELVDVLRKYASGAAVKSASGAF